MPLFYMKIHKRNFIFHKDHQRFSDSPTTLQRLCDALFQYAEEIIPHYGINYGSSNRQFDRKSFMHEWLSGPLWDPIDNDPDFVWAPFSENLWVMWRMETDQINDKVLRTRLMGRDSDITANAHGCFHNTHGCIHWFELTQCLLVCE